jgi:hypothetical protein
MTYRISERAHNKSGRNLRQGVRGWLARREFRTGAALPVMVGAASALLLFPLPVGKPFAQLD